MIVRKQKRYKAIYECYDEGKYIATGTRNELADIINVPRTFAIADHLNGFPYLGRYTFVKVGEKAFYSEVHLKERRSQKHEDVLDYLYRHLKETGVTCLTKDPTPYLSELKEKGIEVKVRRTYNLTGRKRKSWYHVLEVV